jgi:hypothetical protein
VVGHDAADYAGLCHVDRHIERACKAERVGAAMRLDDDTIETEENAPAESPRIDLAAERVESAARKNRTDPCEEGSPQRAAQISRDEPGRAFREVLRPSVRRRFASTHHADKS